jgi:hypothetical protein
LKNLERERERERERDAKWVSDGTGEIKIILVPKRIFYTSSNLVSDQTSILERTNSSSCEWKK